MYTGFVSFELDYFLVWYLGIIHEVDAYFILEEAHMGFAISDPYSQYTKQLGKIFADWLGSINLNFHEEKNQIGGVLIPSTQIIFWATWVQSQIFVDV